MADANDRDLSLAVRGAISPRYISWVLTPQSSQRQPDIVTHHACYYHFLQTFFYKGLHRIAWKEVAIANMQRFGFTSSLFVYKLALKSYFDERN
jgi:hypothetical protein